MWKNSGAFIRWAQTSQSPCVFVGIFGRFCQKIKMGNINLFVVGKMLEYLGLVGRFQNKIPKFSLCFSAEQNCGLNKNPHAGQPQPGSTHTEAGPFGSEGAFLSSILPRPASTGTPESSAKEFGAGFSAWRILYYWKTSRWVGLEFLGSGDSWMYPYQRTPPLQNTINTIWVHC